MKSTKEIAELFSQEIERIAKGDVRLLVIKGLDRCTNAMIKLARLEMDFQSQKDQTQAHWFNGTGGQLPEKGIRSESDQNLNRIRNTKLNHLEKQIDAAKKQLSSESNPTMRETITKKLKHFEDAYALELKRLAL